MDGFDTGDTGVLVLGTTNLPWGLDPAINRRFQKKIYIPLPDENTRASIIKKLLKKEKHSIRSGILLKVD